MDSDNIKRMSFFEMVYEVVKLIPHGRATSYGAVAAYLGTKGSSRMVGWAMNNSHSQPGNVPAHRVVNRNGMLTGKSHFGPGDEMEKLLMAEGIKVENNCIVNFEKIFWDPCKELTLK